MKLAKYLTILTLSILFIHGCGKIEKLPAKPYIRFKSFEVFDSIDILENSVKGGRLNFEFEDGDGDLGLPAPELGTNSDSTNLFFILKRKTGGIFDTVPQKDPIRPSAFRIPYMDRQGQNKILRGSIKITFLYLFSTPNDTIKYLFYLKDRAGNTSNTDSTCIIVLRNNSVCNN
jgi:hypothetical protein